MIEEIRREVLVNISSNALTAVVGVTLYLLYEAFRRRNIVAFFGISRSAPRVSIFLSNIQILPGGSAGIEGIATGYHGPSISKLEYEGALPLQRLLRDKPWPILNDIREGFEGKLLGIRQLEVEIELSPPNPLKDVTISPGTLIVAGSPIYNSYTDYYVNRYFRKDHVDSAYYYFHREADGERVIKLHRKGLSSDSLLQGRKHKVESAFIQRINDSEHGLTVFICAGLGASATYGSLRFLRKHWQRLQRDYGDREFMIGLLF